MYVLVLYETTSMYAKTITERTLVLHYIENILDFTRLL